MAKEVMTIKITDDNPRVDLDVTSFDIILGHLPNGKEVALVDPAFAIGPIRGDRVSATRIQDQLFQGRDLYNCTDIVQFAMAKVLSCRDEGSQCRFFRAELDGAEVEGCAHRKDGLTIGRIVRLTTETRERLEGRLYAPYKPSLEIPRGV
jgi:hypothetical protein